VGYASPGSRQNLDFGVIQIEGRNLRASIEGTVHQVQHPFPAGKLPVRGRFRVTSMMIGSAAMANIFRIQRYLEAKDHLINGFNPPFGSFLGISSLMFNCFVNKRETYT
jgi:hypothetical protein